MIRAVEYLISRGHNERDILYEYSLDKIRIYFEAGRESEKESLSSIITTMGIVMRSAYHSKNREFKKVLKSIDEE